MNRKPKYIIRRIFHLLGSICDQPLLEDKQRFPDSSFTALNSSKDHNASNARISSGSSWCAPISDGKHYLQLDLGRLYVIKQFITFGDSTSPKWVTTYNLYSTESDDLSKWQRIRTVFVTFVIENGYISLHSTHLSFYRMDSDFIVRKTSKHGYILTLCLANRKQKRLQ